ncbi:MAG: endonuclease/exonuclease/phosphatase family protein [Wohlfahrtiimonas sp.]
MLNKIRYKYSHFKVNHVNIYGIPQKYHFNKIIDQYCIETPDSTTLDANDIVLYSWNIYKQKLEDSLPELSYMLGKADIVLLQEARESETLMSIIESNQFKAIHVIAFKDGYYANGVMTISKVAPLSYTAQKYSEPWIRFPKSGLISTYALNNGQQLMIANFHAVNFSLGLKDFVQQLRTIFDILQQHSGPIVLGGDFNTWKKSRYLYIKRMIRELNLKEIDYPIDQRTKVMGKVLDHIFIRGLKIKEAKTYNISASDHNPIRLKLAYEPQTSTDHAY